MSQRRQPRVLLTEGSSCTARTVLYALGGNHTIDILDPSPFCQGRFSRYVRRWIRSPRFAAEPSAFVEFLADLLQRDHYDVVFPTHEEIFAIARAQDRIGRLAGLAVSSFAAVNCLISKANFSRLLTELDIPQPETTIVSSAAALAGSWDFPVYVKSAFGTAGNGVRLVHNDQQLRLYIDQLQLAGRLDGSLEFVVQRPAVGTHGSISAVFYYGQMVGWHSCAARRLGVGGAPMAHVSTHHPVVVDYVRQIGEHLKWHGAAFFDFFYDDRTDHVMFIEGNPRIWQTINGLRSGVNLSKLVVDISMNKTVGRLPPGQVGVRTHEAYLMLMTRAMEGATRRQVIGEMARCWKRDGLYAESHDELTRLDDDWMSCIPYMAIAAQLILSPRSALRIVANTVENYALSPQASRIIRAGFDSETTLPLAVTSMNEPVSSVTR
jgi:predicted ATP-grasp superfamily ATP-dependent carboligase